MSPYTITHYPHGIAIFGPVPVQDLTGITAIGKANGYEYMGLGIAAHLNETQPKKCTFVLVSQESQERWRAEIETKVSAMTWPDNWLKGLHTGISSKTIFAVLGSRAPRLDRNDTPHDAADFGRCVKMLDMAPDDWRSRLDEVAALYPEWGPLVEHWEELEGLWRAEFFDGLNDKINELRGVE